MPASRSPGLEALSMEKVAKRLGVTTMALYRYVPSRAVLVDLMIDRGVGAPPKLEGPWRTRLLRWASALQEIFLRHPWSLESTGRIRVMGPCELSWLEAGMAALGSTALTPAERRSACLALIAQVRTAAQFSAPDRRFGWKEWAELTRSLVASRAERYPELRQVMARDDEAVSGFDWVLDGIAARLAQRAK
jgi:AcrR family transcriptional regulator